MNVGTRFSHIACLSRTFYIEDGPSVHQRRALIGYVITEWVKVLTRNYRSSSNPIDQLVVRLGSRDDTFDYWMEPFSEYKAPSSTMISMSVIISNSFVPSRHKFGCCEHAAQEYKFTVDITIHPTSFASTEHKLLNDLPCACLSRIRHHGRCSIQRCVG
jgi:hypothetical protein